MFSETKVQPVAEYLTQGQLQQAGWTDNLIHQLLGGPDAVRPHPKKPHRNQKLYGRGRVDVAQSLPAWQARQAELVARREAMLAAKQGEVQAANWSEGVFTGAQDWMACDDPEGMLAFVDNFDRLADRRPRANAMLACALFTRRLCHHHAALLDDQVKVAERYADGLASLEELQVAYVSAYEKLREEEEAVEAFEDDLEDYEECCAPEFFLPLAFENCLMAGAPVADKWLLEAVNEEEAADLIREVYGNPFSEAPFEKTWCTPSVLALAQTIYDEKAFDRMPELAAELNRAGCNNEEVLSHCRQKDGHVHGCWVLDLVLGR